MSRKNDYLVAFPDIMYCALHEASSPRSARDAAYADGDLEERFGELYRNSTGYGEPSCIVVDMMSGEITCFRQIRSWREVPREEA